MATIFKNIVAGGTAKLQGQVTCGVGSNTYTMPQTRGLANQTLASDGLGGASWATTGAGILYTSGADVVITSTAPAAADYILVSTSTTTATWQSLANLIQTTYTYRLITSTTNPQSFTALATDNFISCDSTNGAINLTLPVISSFTGGKKTYIVADEAGVANNGTRKITIIAAVGNTINGAASAIINSPNGALTFYANTVSKWVVY